MTIQITKPEVEALINQRLQSGAFKDAEDVILQALRSFPVKANGRSRRQQSPIAEGWLGDSNVDGENWARSQLQNPIGC